MLEYCKVYPSGQALVQVGTDITAYKQALFNLRLQIVIAEVCTCDTSDSGIVP